MELNEETIGSLEIDQADILKRISEELSIRLSQAMAVVELTMEGCTVPFISRYRKERTGELDEVQVRDVVHRHQSLVNLETRRIEVIKAIFSQGKLTDELYANLNKCQTLTEIEDIYAPYKRKKKTRGMVAIEKGLEPLADIMASQSADEVRTRAPEFVVENAENPELTVATAEDAIQGAMDILAERASQDPDNRALVKKAYLAEGMMLVKGLGDDEAKEKSVYQMYWDYSEELARLKAHRVLAINRGEREGVLEVKLEVNEELAMDALKTRTIPANEYHGEALEDSVFRLLGPAVLREIRSEATDSADSHGIGVFSTNLQNLLMAPPLKGTRVLGVDPGIRTGTKCAAVDETGKFLGYFVIYQEQRPAEGKRAIANAVKDYKLELIAVGNGTASHEVQRLVSEAISEHSLDVKYTVVDEDGASVYSASDVAREEFPELDLTIRGAISIGRRLQDPLAELVKIDPKSIGVGLYQHDVNQKRLSDSVDEVVESVVNRVGVNLNTASHSLLKYVSGINSGLAKKIVKYRDENGAIKSREELRKISGMGEKSFEQSAGFLKIPESQNPLDNTWVHPENYTLAGEIWPVIRKGTDPDRDLRKILKEKFGVGDTTIDDIVNELKKPSRDPRDDFPKPILSQGVLSFEDLREGMKVTGKVKNVVDFGAFVDIGIKESALIHVSELSDHYVSDPMDLLKVGDVKEFRIISLDSSRRRIGLSLKSESRSGGGAPAGRGADGSGSAGNAGTGSGGVAAGARRVLVRKAGDAARAPAAGTAERHGEAQHAGAQRPDGQRAGGQRPASKSFSKDDDGETYNPFAALLKK